MLAGNRFCPNYHVLLYCVCVRATVCILMGAGSERTCAREEGVSCYMYPSLFALFFIVFVVF